jgi:NAD(P)H-hydrate epimerase
MSDIQEMVDLPRLSPRAPDSHKGTYGKVLIVAGSQGMSGAAALCGKGALRGGAGLVQVAVPGEILPIVAVHDPCYLTAPLPGDASGRLAAAAAEGVLALASGCAVLALGPGLGLNEPIIRLVQVVLEQAPCPIILDADGLNALARLLPTRTAGQPLRRDLPCILTPHPGEFARLCQQPASLPADQREPLALRFAADHRCLLVLKGHRTLVTDGRRLYRNTTGNPGMATGGTGDVLTGLIAALVGQGLEPFQAAQLGVYLHGLAGDLARERLGEQALIATDLLTYLPQAFLTLVAASQR